MTRIGLTWLPDGRPDRSTSLRSGRENRAHTDSKPTMRRSGPQDTSDDKMLWLDGQVRGWAAARSI
jgi:hypothetical protein